MMPAEDAELLDEIFEFATTSENNALLSMSKNHFTFLSKYQTSSVSKSQKKVTVSRTGRSVFQATSWSVRS